LKPCVFSTSNQIAMSLPTRERGLKPARCCVSPRARVVAPHAGARIETMSRQMSAEKVSRSPRGSAD